jgi:hypothetical protein
VGNKNLTRVIFEHPPEALLVSVAKHCRRSVDRRWPTAWPEPHFRWTWQRNIKPEIGYQ